MVYGKISLNEIKYFSNKRLDKGGGGGVKTYICIVDINEL